VSLKYLVRISTIPAHTDDVRSHLTTRARARARSYSVEEVLKVVLVGPMEELD
jgi:hypothetical protein